MEWSDAKVKTAFSTHKKSCVPDVFVSKRKRLTQVFYFCEKNSGGGLNFLDFLLLLYVNLKLV